MKIVKQFEDPEYLHKIYHWRQPSEFKEEDKFLWGLGDNGSLYFKCSRFNLSDEWHSFDEYNNVPTHLNLKDMKRIVKEFGHLLVFL